VSDFKFCTQLGFAKSHTQRKKWKWPWARRALRNYWVPYNIFATAGASDFEFGTQLGLAKAHYIITRRRKDGRGPGLGELPKIWGSPSIFTQWLKLATSNLVHSLGLPRPTIKPHPEKKWAWPWVREALIYFGYPLIFLQRPRCSLSVSGAFCYWT